MALFTDRRDAGRQLAQQLSHHGSNTLVLGLPRGGVPVAFEVAGALGAPLDVFIVRKLGTPGHPELAMGAVAPGGEAVLNDYIVRELAIAEEAIDAATGEERRELARRDRLYRGDAPALDVHDRSIVLVDDGLATGASMRAAIAALKQQSAARIAAAVPVAAPDVCDTLRTEVDEMVCLHTPESFLGVGRWYEHFPQTSDDEVHELLASASR